MNQSQCSQRDVNVVLGNSIVSSTTGEREADDETIVLKRTFFEIIDTIVSEMTLRFDQNNDILMAIKASNDFLTDDFDYDVLQPLTALNLTLPSREEISVAKTFLLGEKSKETDKKPRKTILELLFPVSNVLGETYRLFEAIETFGSDKPQHVNHYFQHFPESMPFGEDR